MVLFETEEAPSRQKVVSQKTTVLKHMTHLLGYSIGASRQNPPCVDNALAVHDEGGRNSSKINDLARFYSHDLCAAAIFTAMYSHEIHVEKRTSECHGRCLFSPCSVDMEAHMNLLRPRERNLV